MTGMRQIPANRCHAKQDDQAVTQKEFGKQPATKHSRNSYRCVLALETVTNTAHCLNKFGCTFELAAQRRNVYVNGTFHHQNMLILDVAEYL